MTVLFLQRDLSYDADNGNHALTVRATYTVPAGKRAVLRGAHLRMLELAATAVRSAGIIVRVRGATLMTAYTVNAIAQRDLDTDMDCYLSAGDVVDLATVNGSANTLNFQGYVSIQEYQ